MQNENQTSLALAGDFKLEGEVVGVLRVRRSKSGARSFSLLPTSSKSGPSMRSVSGFKGATLRAFHRRQADALKTQLCAMVGGVGASNEWTGRNARVNAKGDMLTVSFKRVEAMRVSVAEVTEEAALKALGLTKEQYAAILDGATEPETMEPANVAVAA